MPIAQVLKSNSFLTLEAHFIQARDSNVLVTNVTLKHAYAGMRADTVVKEKCMTRNHACANVCLPGNRSVCVRAHTHNSTHQHMC